MNRHEAFCLNTYSDTFFSDVFFKLCTLSIVCLQALEGYIDFQFVPEAAVIGMVPNNGLESGQLPVFILGNNFQNSSESLACKFGSYSNSAIFISNSVLMCIAPPHPSGAVTVEVTVNGVIWSKSRLIFHYRRCNSGSYCLKGEEEEVSHDFVNFRFRFLLVKLIRSQVGWLIVG